MNVATVATLQHFIDSLESYNQIYLMLSTLRKWSFCGRKKFDNDNNKYLFHLRDVDKNLW